VNENVSRELGYQRALGADSSELRSSIVARCRQLVEGREVWFFEPELTGNGRSFIVVGSPDRGRFATTGAMVRWLRVNDELLALRLQRDVWEYLPVQEQSECKRQQIDAFVPLVVEAKLVAFLALRLGGEVGSLGPQRGPLERAARLWATQWAEAVATEQKQQQQVALRRTHQLGIAGQMAASVAHEVRNPLTAIRSLVQFASDVPRPHDQTAAILDDVLREVDRMNNIVTGMLELGQVSPPSPRSTDVSVVVSSAVRFLRPYASRQDVVLSCGDTDQGWHVLVDETELRQVLINLLLNACQACPSGGSVSVSIGEGVLDTERAVDIKVSDTGLGMSQEQLSRACEPFFSTKPQGTGLGLAFCRDVVERHRGSIRLDSVPTVGTSVSVILPLSAHGIDSSR
jgi:two-component system, NtrC family, sensor kinase